MGKCLRPLGAILTSRKMGALGSDGTGVGVNTASASLTDNSFAVCSFDILHPVRLQIEHRYEIVLPIHRGNDHGIRVYAAGLVHLNFKNGLKSGRQA